MTPSTPPGEGFAGLPYDQQPFAGQPSTPPGDWEVVEQAVQSAMNGEWGKQNALAALARLREREKVQAGKLSATIRRAEAAEAEVARLREREAQLEEGRMDLARLSEEQLARALAAEARVKELEAVLTWLAKDETWATAWPDGAFGLPPNTWGPAPDWVQTVARHALAHEEERAPATDSPFQKPRMQQIGEVAHEEEAK